MMQLPDGHKIIGLCVYNENTGEADVMFDNYWIKTQEYIVKADALKDVAGVAMNEYEKCIQEENK